MLALHVLRERELDAAQGKASFLTGWPAASVPCGFNSEGLPIALQIVTGWHQDALCLRAAAA